MNYSSRLQRFSSDEHCVNLLDARARYDDMKAAGIRTFADAAEDGDVLVLTGNPNEPFRKSSIPYFIYEGTPVPRTELEAREMAAFIRAKLIEVMNQHIESEARRLSIEALSERLEDSQYELESQQDWYRKAKQTKLFYSSQYTLIELYAARQGWTVGTVSLDPGFTSQLRMMRKELEVNQQILVDLDIRVTQLADSIEKFIKRVSGNESKRLSLGK